MTKSELIFNYYWGYRALLLYALSWIVFRIIDYSRLAQRPEVLYMPSVWFVKLVAPTFPASWVYIGIGLGGLTAASLLLLRIRHILLTAGLLFSLLYLNIILWSYGYLAHVGHHLIWALMLSAFIPSGIAKLRTKPNIESDIRWFYFGFLSTFCLSGIWKIGHIIVSLISKKLNWLSPDAAFLNAISSYRIEDIQLDWTFSLYKYSILFQVGFIGMLILQISAPFFVFRARSLQLLMIGLLIFFGLNAILFHIIFISAPIVVALLLFPYYRYKNIIFILDKRSQAIFN